MEILHSYKNGNVSVTLYDDGTKIQEWDDNESPTPIYPNSMDVKITNFCDAACRFCHEMSTTSGLHGDLEFLKLTLENLPAGTELAIGGGNPLDHPDLMEFLKWCKTKQLVPNMTVNYVHMFRHKFISELLDNKLIYGLGVSIPDSFNPETINLLSNTSNVVYHIIAGVNNISILDKIKNSNINKVLILGYKEVGRGINYKNENVDKCKKEWFEKLPKYIGEVHLSFDNLAIEQLKVKRFFTKKSWENFYMGSDGQFTMYIDAVKQEFSTSSTSQKKFPLKGTIDEIFLYVRQVNNF